MMSIFRSSKEALKPRLPTVIENLGKVFRVIFMSLFYHIKEGIANERFRIVAVEIGLRVIKSEHIIKIRMNFSPSKLLAFN
jgi:hypothetical protein